MPDIWEQWNVDPALNVLPPPNGAPEMETKWKDVNNILRNIMAACRQLGDWQTADDAASGSMSLQDANAVAITGGTIAGVTLNNTNSIDGAAIKTGAVPSAQVPLALNSNQLAGNTVQAFYDAIFPVGALHLMTVEAENFPVPAGVTANWVKTGYYGRFLKIAEPGTLTTFPMISGAIANIPTKPAGGHAHGGKTGPTTLTIAQIPAHNHLQRGGSASGSGSIKNDAGSSGLANANPTADAGGGGAHDHTISSAADHTHDINPSDVPSLSVIAWRRIS